MAIGYDDVATAAEALLADGEQPQWRAIRARLGTGSANTIHRHLTAWRETRPRVERHAELPAVVARAFSDELDRLAAAAREELEAQLREAQQEAVDLATTGEALEARLEALQAQVQTLTSDLDTLRGRASVP